MKKLSGLYPQNVFAFFEQIAAVPRGSGNTAPIADFICRFAKERALRFYRDDTDNVIIYKEATKGYEESKPIILQGHLDMVCQKENGLEFDFLKDGIRLINDGEFISADGTTLGADNGIAVAMALAVLDSNTLPHPPIEAVFTSDEEIGMLGASALDEKMLTAERMINIDEECGDSVTVSCAGGIELVMSRKAETKRTVGTSVTLALKGLLGGHSGVEIDKGRINADALLGRFLNHIKDKSDFDIISLSGGDKANAIPLYAEAVLCTNDPCTLCKAAEEYARVVAEEIKSREPSFEMNLTKGESCEYTVFSKELSEKLIYALLLTPNGIEQMSLEIDGLVETSINLGIMKADSDKAEFVYNFRSNKDSALEALVERLTVFAKMLGFDSYTCGYYPPWEYKEASTIRELFSEIYTEQNGEAPSVKAIHAGLECAVFAGKLKNLDCISIGPTMYDIHTSKERLSIKSVGKIYNILTEMLVRLK